MKSPFIFSKIVTGEKFVGREKEIKKLTNNFRDGINTFIISPRRTGKSSLVRQSVKEFRSPNAKRRDFGEYVKLWRKD
jgi:AAA+ ATPase superfamily predicted ATPase